MYADGELLYAPHLSANGCGVFSPQLTVELNRAGELEFVMPPDNLLYNELRKLKTFVTVYQDGDELFRGRVLHDEKDFYKQKRTFCEGELAFFLDSRIRPYSFSGTGTNLFKKYINEHNSRVESAKRFTIGDITVKTASETISVENESCSATIDELTKNILGEFGGYLKIREGSNGQRYIDLLEESGDISTQTIEFGINLLDISEYITAENVFTVLVPLGATTYDSEGNPTGKVTITSVNNGKDYLENSTAIALFGRIESSEEWNDVDNPTTLKNLARTLLDKNIQLAVSLSVKAVDLHMLDVAYQKIRVGDWVQVISWPHNLDRLFQCEKIVYNLIDPEQTEYTFGAKASGITDVQSANTKNIQNSVSVIKHTATAANTAVAAVQDTVSQIPSEYVSTTTFTEYKTSVDAKLLELNTKIGKLEGGTA
jgi:phage minor structural protein